MRATPDKTETELLSLMLTQGTEASDNECIKVSARVVPHCSLSDTSVKHKYLFPIITKWFVSCIHKHASARHIFWHCCNVFGNVPTLGPKLSSFFSGCVLYQSVVSSRGQTVPPPLRLLLCSQLVVIVSSLFSGGECTTLTWRLVAMEIQGAVAVVTGFLWYRLMR